MGVICNMAGFAALLSPIAFLVKWIPLLGNGIAKFIKGIGSLVGLAVSFVVIAIAWIFFRPLIGILLLAGVVGIVFLIIMLIKKSRAVPTAEQAGMVQQSMMQQGMSQQTMMGQSVEQQSVKPLEQQQDTTNIFGQNNNQQ